jgi:Predicted transcriptional regulators
LKLKELRKTKGISQDEVANALGITLRTYQNYEYGQREPNIEMINKIADFFGVTTDYLLGREPQPNPLAMLNISVNDKKFIEIYNELSDLHKQIFVDTMIKLSEAGEQHKKKS